ncbi:MAG TPA: response regulator [Vicinamibacterales bacterium]|nr:response regulator [Vicinamibacterales bacterium]
MSYRILLVDPSAAATAAAEQALVRAGYRAAAVRTFDQALRQVTLDCPDVLITAIRLAAFNGLHLVIRLRGDHADLPVIVTGHVSDFTADAERYGARFIQTPVDTTELLASVAEALAGREPLDPNSERRWPRRPAGLPATVRNTTAHVVELSYEGIRLRMDAAAAPGDPQPFDVKLPTVGMTVRATPRWASPIDDHGEWWCGAELALSGADDARTWRWLVDTLN